MLLLILTFLLFVACNDMSHADALRLRLMGEGIRVSQPGIRRDTVTFFIMVKERRWIPLVEAIGREKDHRSSLWVVEIESDIVFGKKPKTEENAVLWIYNYLKEAPNA